MAKKREPTATSWMPAPVYGRSLRGMSINLLVRDIARSIAFAQEVLGATVIYGDADFAVLRRELPDGPAEWMLHADHTYADHPLLALTGDNALRGVGIELRLHGVDPDAAAAAAHRRDYIVLAVPRGQAAWPARGLYRRSRRLYLGARCAAAVKQMSLCLRQWRPQPP